jgi:hypothetical protein
MALTTEEKQQLAALVEELRTAKRAHNQATQRAASLKQQAEAAVTAEAQAFNALTDVRKRLAALVETL